MFWIHDKFENGFDDPDGPDQPDYLTGLAQPYDPMSRLVWVIGSAWPHEVIGPAQPIWVVGLVYVIAPHPPNPSSHQPGSSSSPMD